MNSVNHQLAHLETSGLVKLAQTTPEKEYLFRHTLVQDAAYASLLLADRRDFHRTIGETVERLYPERLDEFVAELGQHFLIANMPARALPYFIQAAEQASATFANEEAIAFYRQAVAIARDLEDENLPALCQKLGRALEITSAYDLALTHYQEMEALALERGDKRLELTAVIGQTTLYTAPSTVNDTNAGAIYANRAIALAEELDDQPTQLHISWNLLNLYAHQNEMEKAFTVGEKALALANAQGAREEEAYLANDLARCYIFAGILRPAEIRAARARALWHDLNNLPMLTDSLALSSFVAYQTGNFQQSIVFSNDGKRIGISINNLQAQSFNLVPEALSYFYLGRIDKAFDCLRMSVQLSQQINFTPLETIALAFLATMYVRCGDNERGLTAAQSAFTIAKTKLPRNLVVGVTAYAFVEAALGHSAKAAELIAKAKIDNRYKSQMTLLFLLVEAEIKVLLQNGEPNLAFDVTESFVMRFEELGNWADIPMILLLQGQVLAALGRWDEARQAAEQGMKTAVSTHNRFAHWQLAAFQAQLQTQQGNREEAETLRHEAETIVNEIAAYCPLDLQEIFLNMSEVTAVLHP